MSIISEAGRRRGAAKAALCLVKAYYPRRRGVSQCLKNREEIESRGAPRREGERQRAFSGEVRIKTTMFAKTHTQSAAFGIFSFPQTPRNAAPSDENAFTHTRGARLRLRRRRCAAALPPHHHGCTLCVQPCAPRFSASINNKNERTIAARPPVDIIRLRNVSQNTPAFSCRQDKREELIRHGECVRSFGRSIPSHRLP